MAKRQSIPVQSLPQQPERALIPPVNVVSRNGMLNAGHVCAYLVRPPRFEFNLQQGVLPVARGNRPVRDRFPAARKNRHALSIHGMPRYRRVNRSAVLTQVTVHQRTVTAMRLVRLKLFAQRAVCRVVFCNHERFSVGRRRRAEIRFFGLISLFSVFRPKIFQI